MGTRGDCIVSKINEQIKELQTKLKKIEFLNHILDSAKKYENKDFKDVKEDVISLLEEFVTVSIENIENGPSLKAVKLEGTFTEEDLNILRSMVGRVKTKSQPTTVDKQTPNKVNDPYGSGQPPKASKKDLVDNNDKLTFALDNRHLANKRVTVANDTGMQVHGEVVGLDAPNVVVKTDTGPTIQVPIGNVSLL